ncbi:L-2-hydroxyglutarate oxidase [Alteromonas sp. CI.11.F.A3]|uniref:L-2-hydroxyglutarate oxidase n=1 Tax=Alteromonas sp. CI.11.F.A3 TaxID=3079555 RepID=UPI002941F6A9|nr:L-2-hydroxyglutarate oxidase [Alteromonas sp. CI.11.F.A3]WOI35609.1 L-2-hydroxyglutarate oxidase [Alteromonas sp. CI.11.F.A3]
MSKRYDIAIVGAGIVGAAVLYEYQKRYPQHKVHLIEKEPVAAFHQTGRNSGVIHAGVYYPPGSLKSQYCRQGLEDTIAWCRDHHLPFEQCGKLIVATNIDEVQKLDNLFNNCEINDLSPERVTQSRLHSMEPNITGKEAIFVNSTGITDYTAITKSLMAVATENSTVTAQFNTRVHAIDEHDECVSLLTEVNDVKRRIEADRVICCAGVYADDLIRKQGITPDFKIVPFKGEYYRLSSKYDNVSERLIYPVPNPDMPFLGVHLTKMIGGYTTVGPNAVLAPGREAYDTLPSYSEIFRTLSYQGLWRLLWQFKSSVISEIKSSVSKSYYASLVQKYCPSINEEDLHYYRPGIRAQAVSKTGKMMGDFEFLSTDRVLHVGNAPSPAATSAMPIAKAIIDKMDAT